MELEQNDNQENAVVLELDVRCFFGFDECHKDRQDALCDALDRERRFDSSRVKLAQA